MNAHTTFEEIDEPRGPIKPETYRKFARWFTKAAAETTNTAGGFLVPTGFGPMLRTLLEANGILRRYGRVVPMASELTPCPRTVGAATVYLVGDGGTITPSSTAFDSIGLSAKKLGCFWTASNELMEDAEEFGAYVSSEFARAMAQAEDTCVFNGDGTSTYYGFSGITPALQSGNYYAGMVAASGHDTFAEIDATDLTNLVARLPTRAHANARWYISHTGFGQVFGRLGTGGGLLSVNNEPWFGGFPITLTPQLPTTTGDLSASVMLLLGDLQQAAVLGERREYTFRVSSTGSSFASAQSQMRGTERIDIVTSHDLGTSTAAGSVVGLIGE